MNSWRHLLSGFVGWAADIRVPRLLRPLVYGAFARLSGADLGEAQLRPLDYPSVTALFVRRLRPGARQWCELPLFACPADGRLQSVARIGSDGIWNAKGQEFTTTELLGPAAGWLPAGELLGLTVYLSPRDYHRVHAPLDCRLVAAWRLGGSRLSVAPKMLARRPRVHAENERVVLALESAEGPFVLVLVGALNVGRVRVVGLSKASQGALDQPLAFERGGELGRFELGSTAIVVWPQAGPGARLQALEELGSNSPLKLGQAWALLLR